MRHEILRHKQTGRSVMIPLSNTLGILWILSLLVFPVVAAAEPQPQLAPVSSEFQRYLENASSKSTSEQVADFTTTEPLSTGYLPSPNDYSHLRGKSSLIQHQEPVIQRAYAALQYDLRTLGRVTAVRNQGQCGACWTFGSVASLESGLLPGETWDFSENNLKNTSGFDWPSCSGGNGDMAIAYFSRWSGPVSETEDPYSDSSSVSPAGLLPKKHVQEVLIIPGRGSALDNDGIKQALMDYGAVTTSIYVDGGITTYHDSSYYKLANSAYYYNGSSDSNHIVAIVGWDDTYSKSNFSTTPPGNGAFIAKNSWGTSFGNSGYFYISYYDSLVGDANYLFKSATDITLYARVYQYDQLGKTSTSGYGSTKGWFANIFNALQSESLAAVSFHTNDINATYNVFVYKGVSADDPVAGTLSATISGTIPYPGYHTLTLPTPVSLSNGERFSVVVELTNSTNTYPIPLEGPIGGYTSKANASAGQSFMSFNGSVWQDVSSSYPKTNVALKAFTQNAAAAVNGACGSSNGSTFATAPSSNFCSSGTSSAVTGSGPWSWSCAGSNGGTMASCTAYSSTPSVSGTTQAKAYLGSSNDILTVGNSGATVYGGAGNDAISITTGMSGVILDQNIERINLSGTSGSYRFKQTGNKINVYDTAGTTLVVNAPVQGDSDGTVLSFSNGIASAILTGGVMKLGGATVSSTTATALTPTTTISTPSTATTTAAKVYLGSTNDIFSVGNSGMTLYGGAGVDAVTIAGGMSGVILDQNVERINLAGVSNSYRFRQTGNKINVYDTAGTTLIVNTPVQGDSDGTVLSFSNGAASAILSGGVMTLGGAVVSSTSASALSPTLK